MKKNQNISKNRNRIKQEEEIKRQIYTIIYKFKTYLIKGEL